MEESPSFELPKPNEKLAYKFILDSLREAETVSIDESLVEQPALSTAPEAVLVAEEEPATAVTEEQVVAAAETPVAVEESEPLPVPLEPLGLPAGKKYFRVREVAELTGVEPYVLRYWESEFSTVRPTKSRTGQRVYSRRDVEELHLIRHLLHIEKYSIKGAKKKLQERRQNRANAADTLMRQRQQQVLKELQGQLRELMQIIRGNPGLRGE